MKQLEIIARRKAVTKARGEYHSFMSVRTLKDIWSSVSLVKQMMFLEDKLVDAVLDLRKTLPEGYTEKEGTSNV